MNIDGFIAPIVAIALGAELLVSVFSRSALFALGDTVSNLGVGFLQRAMHVVVDVLFMGLYATLYSEFAPYKITADSVLGFVALVILLDLNAYWYHRFSHRVNFAWAAHSVHHQSEEMNLTVGFRISLTSVPIHWMFLLPFALLGFDPIVFFLTYTVVTAYELWYHTKSIGRLGWLEQVLVTPSNHRLHHGYNAPYIDKNYGAMFCVWDRWFGTFQDEVEAPRFGTTAGLGSYNPVRALIDPFREIYQQAREFPRWHDQWLVWIKPPGWRPKDAPIQLPNASRLSPTRSTTPSSLAAYIIINCAMLIPTIVGLTHVVDPMAAHYRAGLIPFVALNFGILSWLATGSRAAIVFEIGRLALWAVTVPLTTDRIGLTHSTGLEVGAALAVLLALHLAIATYANRRMSKMMLSRETEFGRTGKVDVHGHKGWWYVNLLPRSFW